MITLKVQQLQDGALGVVLDEEALRVLGVAVGDTLNVEKVDASAPAAEHAKARQLRYAREFLEEYRETFEALAR